MRRYGFKRQNRHRKDNFDEGYHWQVATTLTLVQRPERQRRLAAHRCNRAFPSLRLATLEHVT